MPSIYARQLSDRVALTTPNPDATGLFWGVAWASMSNISATLLQLRSRIDFSDRSRTEVLEDGQAVQARRAVGPRWRASGRIGYQGASRIQASGITRQTVNASALNQGANHRGRRFAGAPYRQPPTPDQRLSGDSRCWLLGPMAPQQIAAPDVDLALDAVCWSELLGRQQPSQKYFEGNLAASLAMVASKAPALSACCAMPDANTRSSSS